MIAMALCTAMLRVDEGFKCSEFERKSAIGQGRTGAAIHDRAVGRFTSMRFVT
jgi:hypothetical protein